tara:strand:- start:66 stop:734 length:669 start_codon:yes stop_codon:yes gene_type:complete
MVLEIISVYFYRNKRIIFDNFNLKLKKSQIMILIGKNGIGKTTLFDLIVGILEPKNGIIKINEIPIEDLYSDKRFLFTYLPHKDSLKENLTVRENLEIWANLSENENNFSTINSSLKYFNIYDLSNNFIGNLSQGQRKKVSLSKLLLTKTNLWLLDEPFNGLDKSSISQTIKLLENHAKNGGSVLISNHINVGIKNSQKVFLKRKENKDKKIITLKTWDDIK